MKTDIMEDFRPVDPIAKSDTIECNRPPDRRKHGATDTDRGLWARVEDVAEPFDREAGLMKILPDLRDPQNRHAHAAREHVEGDQSANSEIALDNQPCTEEQNG